MGSTTDVAPEAMETHKGGFSPRFTCAIRAAQQCPRQSLASTAVIEPIPQWGLYNIDQFFLWRRSTILGTIYGRGCLALWGKSVPMPKRIAKKPDRNCSGGHSISQSQEPLPPYELDPVFNDLVIRNRIGEVIAKAVAKRRKPDPRNLAPTR
jgi:hypothetical protein